MSHSTHSVLHNWPWGAMIVVVWEHTEDWQTVKGMSHCRWSAREGLVRIRHICRPEWAWRPHEIWCNVYRALWQERFALQGRSAGGISFLRTICWGEIGGIVCWFPSLIVCYTIEGITITDQMLAVIAAQTLHGNLSLSLSLLTERLSEHHLELCSF